MESHFSVKVIPTLLQEAQFLSHYFTPPKNLPKLLPDYEAVLTGKRIHPVKYQHAHGPGVPIELLGSLEVTALLDEKQLALLIAPAACRVLAKRLPDGRIAIAAASDIGASKGLPKEVGIAMAVEGLMSTTPFADTVRERCFAASHVHCGDGVSLLVRSHVKLSDSEGTPIGVLSNHSKSFNRWMELYLEMLFTGAKTSLIVFHQKNLILRFEEYAFDVVESMCETEISVMHSSLGKTIRDIEKLVQETEKWYEIHKTESGVIESSIKAH